MGAPRIRHGCGSYGGTARPNTEAEGNRVDGRSKVGQQDHCSGTQELKQEQEQGHHGDAFEGRMWPSSLPLVLLHDKGRLLNLLIILYKESYSLGAMPLFCMQRAVGAKGVLLAVARQVMVGDGELLGSAAGARANRCSAVRPLQGPLSVPPPAGIPSCVLLLPLGDLDPPHVRGAATAPRGGLPWLSRRASGGCCATFQYAQEGAPTSRYWYQAFTCCLVSRSASMQRCALSSQSTCFMLQTSIHSCVVQAAVVE